MTDDDGDAAELGEIVRAVTESPKYRRICPDFVRRLAETERGRNRSTRAAVKAVKNRLHQVAGAFLAGRRDYAAWAAELGGAPGGGPRPLHESCRRILERHASTRERLPRIESFYAEIFREVGPVRSVLDLACGMNPLTIPWMGLSPDTEYRAIDVHEDLASFLTECFSALPVRGRAEVRDLIHDPPAARADAAFFFKTLPCFDRVDPEAGWRLLEGLEVRHLFVSFPVRSLGGREKGMRDHHGSRFEEELAGRRWPIRRFDFPSELVYRIDRERIGEDGRAGSAERSH